jgi:hypothetical protein
VTTFTGGNFKLPFMNASFGQYNRMVMLNSPFPEGKKLGDRLAFKLSLMPVNDGLHANKNAVSIEKRTVEIALFCGMYLVNLNNNLKFYIIGYLSKRITLT